MRKHEKRKNWATHDIVVKDGQGRLKALTAGQITSGKGYWLMYDGTQLTLDLEQFIIKPKVKKKIKTGTTYKTFKDGEKLVSKKQLDGYEKPD